MREFYAYNRRYKRRWSANLCSIDYVGARSPKRGEGLSLNLDQHMRTDVCSPDISPLFGPTSPGEPGNWGLDNKFNFEVNDVSGKNTI